MRKILFIALFILCSASIARAQGQALVTFKVPDEIKITYESVTQGQARQFIDQIAESVDAEITVVYGSLSAALGDGRVLAMLVSDSKTTEELIQTLKDHPNVLSARPNHKVKLMN